MICICGYVNTPKKYRTGMDVSYLTNILENNKITVLIADTNMYMFADYKRIAHCNNSLKTYVSGETNKLSPGILLSINSIKTLKTIDLTVYHDRHRWKEYRHKRNIGTSTYLTVKYLILRIKPPCENKLCFNIYYVTDDKKCVIINDARIKIYTPTNDSVWFHI